MRRQAAPTAWLVLEGGGGGRRFPLGTEPLSVGRGPDADLRFADRSLSALHCRLEPAGGGWKVADLASRNGTFVNDTLVQQRLLEGGDRIRVGHVVLRFEESTEGDEVIRGVDRLVAETLERHGREGLERLLRRMAVTAAKEDIPGVLAGEAERKAMRRLQDVVSAMIEEPRTQAVFDRILDTLIEFTGAERGFFLLAEGEAEEGGRDVVAARNFDREEVVDARAKVSRTVERQALASGDPVVVMDASADERFTGTESVAAMRLRSILAVPVRARKGPVGLIYLDNRFERGVFDEARLPLVRMFADQAAVALENARLHEAHAARLEELAGTKEEVEELNRILAERVARTSAELQEVKEHVLREREDAPLKYSYQKIVGESRRMQDLFHLLDKVTDSDVPVLIQGESGVGKELVARAIHFNGPRKDRPFVSENCAAIPETLLESELFGYRKGAFTGAHADKKGLFEVANGGTLFLDEIGDMDLSMQAKLLRVLQDGELRPVGGKQTVRVDVRILAASNQDLRRLCEEGRFREDLLYRLNVITVEVPPLRERVEDIPLLVERFLDEFADQQGQTRTISDDALRALKRHRWPGNVRELRNEVQRAAALSDQVITPLVLSPAIQGGAGREDPPVELGERSLKEMVREVTEEIEARAIRAALKESGGKKAGAARRLGISRPTLDAKIEAYGISPRDP